MKRSRAFTTIELVLVIALLGILTAAAVVAMRVRAPNYLAAAVQKAVADIEYARTLALTNRGTIYGVEFSAAQNNYTVYENTIATPVSSPLDRQPMVEDMSDFSGVIIAGNYVVEFDEIGQATIGVGPGFVTLNDGTTTRQIAVAPETGRVTVE